MSHDNDFHGINNIFREIQQAYRLAQKRTVSPTSFIHRPATAGDSTDQIDILRDQIVDLDGKINSQILIVDTLHRVLRDAEHVYASLEEERGLLIQEINEFVLKERTPISLPTEIILEICSHLTPDDLDSVLDVWGDISRKSIARELTFRELFKLSHQELMDMPLIQISDTIGNRYLRITRTLNDGNHLGVWKQLSLNDACPALWGFQDVIKACVPYLLTVKKLEIDTRDDKHECGRDQLGCIGDIVAPSCTELSVPITLLPCSLSLKSGGVLHLEIYLGDRWASSLEEFSSYFQGFNMTHLQTLAIHWRPKPDFDFHAPEVKLRAPNLRTFSTHVKDGITSPEIFFAFSKCFECPKLESLEIFGKFSNPKRGEHYLFGPSHIQRFQGTLMRLSFHLKLPNLNANVRFLSNLFNDLQEKTDRTVPFPHLKYLSISYDDPWPNFNYLHTLLEALSENRAKAGAPIQTVELVINAAKIPDLDDIRRLQIERLKLLVNDVVIKCTGSQRNPNRFRF